MRIQFILQFILHGMSKVSDARISVIIATYNRAHLIVRALDSVVIQSLQPAEIIVVDDKSEDETLSVVQSWSASHDIPVKIMQTKENSGPGFARNVGMKAASGSYYAFLNSDDEYYPNALSTLYSAFSHCVEAVVSFADAQLNSTQGRKTGKMMQPNLPPEALRSLQPITGTDIQILEQPRDAILLHSMIPTCAALFRADIAMKTQLMPEFRFGEDWIFWLRMSEYGPFLCQMKDVATVHRDDRTLTGPDNNFENARQSLIAYIDLRNGDYVALEQKHILQLNQAISEKICAYRYHASLKGLRNYLSAISMPEATEVHSRLGHLILDPKSAVRAVWQSLRSI